MPGVLAGREERTAGSQSAIPWQTPPDEWRSRSGGTATDNRHDWSARFNRPGYRSAAPIPAPSDRWVFHDGTVHVVTHRLPERERTSGAGRAWRRSRGSERRRSSARSRASGDAARPASAGRAGCGGPWGGPAGAAVRWLIRDDRSAICTSGEPVSVSCVRCASMVSCLGAMSGSFVVGDLARRQRHRSITPTPSGSSPAPRRTPQGYRRPSPASDACAHSTEPLRLTSPSTG